MIKSENDRCELGAHIYLCERGVVVGVVCGRVCVALLNQVCSDGWVGDAILYARQQLSASGRIKTQCIRISFVLGFSNLDLVRETQKAREAH